MRNLGPRLSTGFGSNIAKLGTPQYGNLVFPQAGTLPVRRERASAGLGDYTPGADDPDGSESTAVLVNDDGSDAESLPIGTDEVPRPPVVFETTVTESVFPWELLALGAALYFLMDSKKKGGNRHG